MCSWLSWGGVRDTPCYDVGWDFSTALESLSNDAHLYNYYEQLAGCFLMWHNKWQNSSVEKWHKEVSSHQHHVPTSYTIPICSVLFWIMVVLWYLGLLLLFFTQLSLEDDISVWEHKTFHTSHKPKGEEKITNTSRPSKIRTNNNHDGSSRQYQRRKAKNIWSLPDICQKTPPSNDLRGLASLPPLLRRHPKTRLYRMQSRSRSHYISDGIWNGKEDRTSQDETLSKYICDSFCNGGHLHRIDTLVGHFRRRFQQGTDKKEWKSFGFSFIHFSSSDCGRMRDCHDRGET